MTDLAFSQDTGANRDQDIKTRQYQYPLLIIYFVNSFQKGFAALLHDI